MTAAGSAKTIPRGHGKVRAPAIAAAPARPARAVMTPPRTKSQGSCSLPTARAKALSGVRLSGWLGLHESGTYVSSRKPAPTFSPSFGLFLCSTKLLKAGRAAHRLPWQRSQTITSLFSKLISGHFHGAGRSAATASRWASSSDPAGINLKARPNLPVRMR